MDSSRKIPLTFSVRSWYCYTLFETAGCAKADCFQT